MDVQPHTRSSTLGQPLRDEPRCHWCCLPIRGWLEDQVERSARGLVMEGGDVRCTNRWMQSEEGIAVIGTKLNNATIGTHRRRHWAAAEKIAADPVTAAAARDSRTALAEYVEEHDGEIPDVHEETFLRRVVAIGHAKINAHPDSVTVNMSLEAAKELGRRKADDRDAQLMWKVAQAISDDQKRKLAAETAADQSDVIEATIVEEIPADTREPESVLDTL
jgi:hypothetical protein